MAALLLPALGHAAYSIDHVSISCSSSLTQTAEDALSSLCYGHLSLQGDGQIGTLRSDTGIKLSTTAPVVTIHAGFSQMVPTPTVTLTPVDTSAGFTGLIVVGKGVSPVGETAIPEPSSAMLILLGLTGMAWLRPKH